MGKLSGQCLKILGAIVAPAIRYAKRLHSNRPVSQLTAEPSSCSHFVRTDLTRLLTSDEMTQDDDRKAKMTAPELTWELLLEQHLGSYYLPLYKRDKLARRETSWDFVHSIPELPNILIVGDSISRGYTMPCRRMLQGKANVFRAPENCGSVSAALPKLDLYLQNKNWHTIIFNFGIHDRDVPASRYMETLDKITSKLCATGARLLFVLTTPVVPAESDFENARIFDIFDLTRFWFRFGTGHNESRLNEFAKQIMSKHEVPVIDLDESTSVSLQFLRKRFDVHYPEDCYSILAEPIVDAVCSGFTPTEIAVSAVQRIKGEDDAESG